MPTPFKTTQYGFEWGAARVTRCCSEDKKGWVLLQVGTVNKPYEGFQIYVTKTGKIRVYSPNNVEFVEYKKKRKKK